MHKIDLNKISIRTDLILEQQKTKKDQIIEYKDIKITHSKIDKYNYTTIYFNDITDKDNFKKVQKVFVEELKKYLNMNKKDKILVIGLGNSNSTPDSLGPKTIDNILVTSYLFDLGEVEEGYSNVCSFKPSVTGNTGIETLTIVKSIIEKTNVTKTIIIDSLKASKIERLTKTIQITNSGIHPGSGINNTRKEISDRTTNTEIIAIGVPTVVDIKTIIENLLKEEIHLEENLIVTPTNIDFIIEKLGLLIGNGINITLHKNFIRQNNI